MNNDQFTFEQVLIGMARIRAIANNFINELAGYIRDGVGVPKISDESAALLRAYWECQNQKVKAE